MKRFSVAILLVICMLSGAMTTMAATYKASDVARPPFGFLSKSYEVDYLADPDNFMNRRDRMMVDSLIAATRNVTGLDVAAVLVEDVDGDIKDFAKELYSQWHLGSKVSVDNGVLVVVLRNRGGQCIIYGGPGTLSSLPRTALSKVEQKKMIPALRNHDPVGAITVAMEQIQKVYADPKAAEAELDALPSPHEDINLWWIGGILLACIVIAIIVKVVSKKKTTKEDNK